MKHRYEWAVIPEMDNEDGTHTGYASRTRNGHLVWLSQNPDQTWDVETNDGFTYRRMATCKTLVSAKRWVARYM